MLDDENSSKINFGVAFSQKILKQKVPINCWIRSRISCNYSACTNVFIDSILMLKLFKKNKSTLFKI